MGFLETLARGETILTEGSIIERIRRDSTLELDPDILHAAFVFDPRLVESLAAIHRDYLDVAIEYELPMVLHTPTWQANPERTARASDRSCAEVNRAGVEFQQSIRDERSDAAHPVFIAGLMKCRGDAYDPRTALSIDDAARFHEDQGRALAEAGVDFLLASTLPAISEAQGMGRALAATGAPYVLSFVLRAEGTLLDGTPLHEAIATIDGAVDPAPAAYWCNCTHARLFGEAMDRQGEHLPHVASRMIGLQANTSALTPEELEGATELHGEDPGVFADGILEMHRRHGTRILGGCCGTESEHIRQLASRLRD